MVVFDSTTVNHSLGWQLDLQRARAATAKAEAEAARAMSRPSRPPKTQANPENLKPYPIHPTPCTPHPTPHTLHLTPCTLHPTPYTLHPTPSNLSPSTKAPNTAPARLTCTLNCSPWCFVPNMLIQIPKACPSRPSPGPANSHPLSTP